MEKFCLLYGSKKYVGIHIEHHAVVINVWHCVVEAVGRVRKICTGNHLHSPIGNSCYLLPPPPRLGCAKHVAQSLGVPACSSPSVWNSRLLQRTISPPRCRSRDIFESTEWQAAASKVPATNSGFSRCPVKKSKARWMQEEHVLILWSQSAWRSSIPISPAAFLQSSCSWYKHGEILDCQAVESVAPTCAHTRHIWQQPGRKSFPEPLLAAGTTREGGEGMFIHFPQKFKQYKNLWQRRTSSKGGQKGKNRKKIWSIFGSYPIRNVPAS